MKKFFNLILHNSLTIFSTGFSIGVAYLLGRESHDIVFGLTIFCFLFWWVILINRGNRCPKCSGQLCEVPPFCANVRLSSQDEEITDL